MFSTTLQQNLDRNLPLQTVRENTKWRVVQKVLSFSIFHHKIIIDIHMKGEIFLKYPTISLCMVVKNEEKTLPLV